MREQLSLGLDNLAVFAEVVAAGGFTAAARKLGVRKSSVSRRVTQLEERLGVQLLHRTTRQLRLTDVGAEYYRRCAQAIAEVRDAERVLSSTRREPRGTLRLTTTESIADLMLGPIIADFLARYPKVNLVVDTSKKPLDLIAAGFDLAIRVGALPDSTSLKARTLGHARPCYCASVEYLRRAPPLRRPEDLAHHDCSIVSDGPETTTWPFVVPRTSSGAAETGELEYFRVQVPGRLVTPSFALVRRAVLAGCGVALLPFPMVAGDVDSGRLVPVLSEFTAPSVALQAVYPGRRARSAVLARFLEVLEERFADPDAFLTAAG